MSLVHSSKNARYSSLVKTFEKTRVSESKSIQDRIQNLWQKTKGIKTFRKDIIKFLGLCLNAELLYFSKIWTPFIFRHYNVELPSSQGCN